MRNAIHLVASVGQKTPNPHKDWTPRASGALGQVVQGWITITQG